MILRLRILNYFFMKTRVEGCSRGCWGNFIQLPAGNLHVFVRGLMNVITLWAVNVCKNIASTFLAVVWARRIV